MIFCVECEYPADDAYDLVERMVEYHTEKYHQKLNCHYCDYNFNDKNSLMKHRKETHAEKYRKAEYTRQGFTINFVYF